MYALICETGDGSSFRYSFGNRGRFLVSLFLDIINTNMNRGTVPRFSSSLLRLESNGKMTTYKGVMHSHHSLARFVNKLNAFSTGLTLLQIFRSLQKSVRLRAYLSTSLDELRQRFILCYPTHL